MKHVFDHLLKFFLLIINLIVNIYIIAQNKIKFKPKKETVITQSFQSFSNFFPIATIDLNRFGINRNIPLVYVFFGHSENGFTDSDDIDHFSYILKNNGKIEPTFQSSSLEVEDDYKIFLERSVKKFKDKATKNKLWWVIEFLDEPEWWQNDETPQNSFGVDMKFICQIDLDDLVEGDVRMYVFFNEIESEIRIIYQRT